MIDANAPSLQFAALPYRRCAGGVVEIMLITSLDTGRWIIPKGWPVRGLAPHESAAREALEEGGVVGRIGERAIGRYRYAKRHSDGTAVQCTVETFALEVETQLSSWPEDSQRQTRWFSLLQAADAVAEPELRAMIRNLVSLLPSD